MRPYQLPLGGPWVDLDTIQSLTPPYLAAPPDEGVCVVLGWRHAFQNQPTYLTWQLREKTEYTFDWLDERREMTFVPEENGTWPKALAEIHDNVFAPFFYAWTFGRATPLREEYKLPMKYRFPYDIPKGPAQHDSQRR